MHFKKETERSYRCTVPVKITNDNLVQEKQCGFGQVFPLATPNNILK